MILINVSTHGCHFTFADSVDFPSGHTSQFVINVTSDTPMIGITCGTSNSPPTALFTAGKLSNCSSFSSSSTSTGEYRIHLQLTVRENSHLNHYNQLKTTSKLSTDAYNINCKISSTVDLSRVFQGSLTRIYPLLLAFCYEYQLVVTNTVFKHLGSIIKIPGCTLVLNIGTPGLCDYKTERPEQYTIYLSNERW